MRNVARPAGTLTHQFVENVPDELEDRVLYVSMLYATVIHLCVCGCRREVVTPLSPAEWQLTFDGETISLSPSVGNWNFPCQSHYWIRRNRVRWASPWTAQEIATGRVRDRQDMRNYLERATAEDVETRPEAQHRRGRPIHWKFWRRPPGR